jgi:probable F420-dependent oxidoreductase
MAIADSTKTLRICPLVLNNDFHHPVHLAQELASLDHLSGGRLEVGIGAGHSFTEYEAIGQRFDPPSVRKARLAESVEVLRQLLDGRTVTYDGEHYSLRDVRTLRSHQDRVPLLVGVNGKRALGHAARHADIIGLTMFGRTLEDGQRHEARWDQDRLDATVAYINDQAGERWDQLELNVLVQAVVVTNDRQKTAEQLAIRVPGLSVQDALSTPFLAIGTHDEIADHLEACRNRWGISYFSVRDLEGFAPVIHRLRDT